MPNRNHLYSTQVVQLLAPVAVAATNTPSSGVDLQGADSVDIEVSTGAITGSPDDSNKYEFTLEESDSVSSGFTAVAENDMVGATSGTTTGNFGSVKAAGDAAKVKRVGYKGSKRYIRVVSTKTGTLTVVLGINVRKGTLNLQYAV